MNFKEMEMNFAIDQIDQRTGTYVVFEVMTEQGPSKRTAFDYITGKAIIEGWKDRILSCAIVMR